jgi:hypothetical protein
MDFEAAILVCRAEGYPSTGEDRAATLRVGICERSGEHAGLNITLTWAGREFVGSVMCPGHSVRRFIEELTRLHATLKGSARLVDGDNDVILCLSAVNRARGKVAVGGRVRMLTSFPTTVSDDRFVRGTYVGGVQVNFDGLCTDQSCISGFLAGLAASLN